MKKSTKIWLIVAAALILVGALILCCVMIETKGEFMKLALNKPHFSWDIQLIR